MTVPAEPEAIRLLSWNIHGFVGKGRAPDMERTLAAIARLSPDIAALQEVDGRVHLGRRPYPFEHLAERLGGYRAEARTLPRADGRDYGHLLWSRWPIRSAAVRRLPGGLEPRAAIDAVVETPAGPLRILAVHLSLSPAARRRQALVLAGLVSGAPALATVVLGDTNEWRPNGAVHRILAAAAPVCACPRSWPAIRPVAAFDRGYAAPGVRLLSADLDAQARDASDHLPLLACVAPGPR